MKTDHLQVHKLTVTTPNKHNVDSGPNKNIDLNIMDPINVRMPDSRGNVTTITKENIKMAQNNKEIWGLSSEMIKYIEIH